MDTEQDGRDSKNAWWSLQISNFQFEIVHLISKDFILTSNQTIKRSDGHWPGRTGQRKCEMEPTNITGWLLTSPPGPHQTSGSWRNGGQYTNTDDILG